MGGSGAFNTGQAYSLEGANMTPISEYRLIPLTQGQFAIVDADKYDWLNQWKWYAYWNPNNKSFYVRRNEFVGGIQFGVRMHRQILGLDKGDPRHADHINHNTLDNRVCNLRIATFAENMQNRYKHSNNTSDIPGVSFHKRFALWQSRVSVNGKRIHLGYCKEKSDALALRIEGEKKYFGKFAFRKENQ